MTDTPYQTPQNIDAPFIPPSDTVKVRREHIKTEASIKSVGILYFLGGFALLAAGFAELVGIPNTPTMADLTQFATVAALIGQPHLLHVTTANISDKAGAKEMLTAAAERLGKVKAVLADGGYGKTARGSTPHRSQ